MPPMFSSAFETESRDCCLAAAVYYKRHSVSGPSSEWLTDEVQSQEKARCEAIDLRERWRRFRRRRREPREALSTQSLLARRRFGWPLSRQLVLWELRIEQPKLLTWWTSSCSAPERRLTWVSGSDWMMLKLEVLRLWTSPGGQCVEVRSDHVIISYRLYYLQETIIVLKSFQPLQIQTRRDEQSGEYSGLECDAIRLLSICVNLSMSSHVVIAYHIVVQAQGKCYQPWRTISFNAEYSIDVRLSSLMYPAISL